MCTPLKFSLLAALTLAASALADDAPLTFITTADLARRVEAGPPAGWSFALIDARTRTEFDEGHVPGALNVPASKTKDELPKLVKDKARELVFYCNGPTCTKSQKGARAALAAGYTKVLEYNEGLPAWGKAGKKIDGAPLPAFEAPSVSADDLKKLLDEGKAPVLLDVRDASEFEGAHLKGALNVPVDELKARAKELPAGKELCLVDHAGHQTAISGRLLNSLGFKAVKRLDGGVTGWQKKGLAVEGKPAAK